ncbi:MAG: threonylcarbamoyl-AMP synthase [Deltaproteobacteria bacterium]|jgi:L-threonylcarbamoyladenylate synthase|nr:threonylcarbamoyl-AMP synthase [Deltaproteobacteria bacterium]
MSGGLSFQAALSLLLQGRLLLYPTETFYAIGGNALNPDSVQAVYRAKVRNAAVPLPVIIGGMDQLNMLASHVPETAWRLIRLFWPGPLTLLLPAAPGLPAPLTGGSGKVAARLSSHPEASRLSLEAGFPLISSSANLSGEAPALRPEDISPVLLRAVHNALYQAEPLPAGGLPSTIIDPVPEEAAGPLELRLVRLGAIPARRLEDMGFSLI